MVARGNSGMSSSSSEASPSRQITVVDVYDLASAIGKDFERLIDQFGTECVRELMPKVISSLETLEALASRNERENEEIISLKKTVERLEAEKQEKKEGRQKYEKELEQIEENYRREIQELWCMVSKLQEDNKRLASSLDSQKDQSPVATLKEEDLKVMLNLKDTVDNQRDQIKTAMRDNDEKDQELESVRQHLEKLTRINKELQRKNKAIQNQGRVLVEEKAELISQLQKCELHLIELEHKLGETEKAKKDLEQTKSDIRTSGENQNFNPATTSSAGYVDVSAVLSDLRDAVRARFSYWASAYSYPPYGGGVSVAVPAQKFQTTARYENVKAAAGLAEEAQGENTPRFTLAELREVLQEKNTLKARVMELEEELEQLRPAATPSPQPPEKGDEEEYVVYGPINKEPDDKLYPWKYSRKDSGVRKFFSRFRRKKAVSPSRHDDNRTQDSPDLACSSSSVSFSKTAPAETIHLYPQDTSWPLLPTEPIDVGSSGSTSVPRADFVQSKNIDDDDLGLAETPIEFSLNYGDGIATFQHNRSSSRDMGNSRSHSSAGLATRRKLSWNWQYSM